jgi:hypothetical protein
LAPDRPAKAGDNSTDLKILNQRFLNLPETRLPESIFLPGKPLLSTTGTPANPALGLLEVVQSVDRSYPPLMADSEALVVDAEAEFQRNWADYRAAVGLDAVDFNPNARQDLKPEAKRDPSALRTRFSRTPKNTTPPK